MSTLTTISVKDVMADIVEETKLALELPTLNYQFNYSDELNQTLENWSKTPDFVSKKYPLVWVAPARERKDKSFSAGSLEPYQVFIINNSEKAWTAEQRITENFQKVIEPIYREMLNQFCISEYVGSSVPNRTKMPEIISHDFGIYFWPKEQNFLNDTFDCAVISNLKLEIYYQQTLTTFKNF